MNKQKKIWRAVTALALSAALMLSVSAEGIQMENKPENKNSYQGTMDLKGGYPASNQELKGDWLCEDGSIMLSFDGESNYVFYDYYDRQTGTYCFEEDTLLLRDEGGNETYGYMNKNGRLNLEKYYVSFVHDTIADGGESIDTAEPKLREMYYKLAGTWTNTESKAKLTFDKQWGYNYTDNRGVDEGTYQTNGIFMVMNRANGEQLRGHLKGKELVIEGINGIFLPDKNRFPKSYFEKYGFSMDGVVGNKKTTLENGAAHFVKHGERYRRRPVQWKVLTCPTEYVGESYKEIKIEASCYYLKENDPHLGKYENHDCFFDLIDYYTGYQLPFSKNNYDEATGLHTVILDIDGIYVPIDYKLERENLGPRGKYMGVDKRYITVRCPTWYDGLVFAVNSAPATAEGYYQLAEEESERLGYDLALMTEIEGRDPSASIYYYVNGEVGEDGAKG